MVLVHFFYFLLRISELRGGRRVLRVFWWANVLGEGGEDTPRSLSSLFLLGSYGMCLLEFLLFSFLVRRLMTVVICIVVATILRYIMGEDCCLPCEQTSSSLSGCNCSLTDYYSLQSMRFLSSRLAFRGSSRLRVCAAGLQLPFGLGNFC